MAYRILKNICAQSTYLVKCGISVKEDSAVQSLYNAMFGVHMNVKQFIKGQFCLFGLFVCLFVCFVALHPKSTAMVMAGRSVHLTTLFPAQA